MGGFFLITIFLFFCLSIGKLNILCFSKQKVEEKLGAKTPSVLKRILVLETSNE